jgi:hypothetical protein
MAFANDVADHLQQNGHQWSMIPRKRGTCG